MKAAGGWPGRLYENPPPTNTVWELYFCLPVGKAGCFTAWLEVVTSASLLGCGVDDAPLAWANKQVKKLAQSWPGKTKVCLEIPLGRGSSGIPSPLRLAGVNHRDTERDARENILGVRCRF